MITLVVERYEGAFVKKLFSGHVDVAPRPESWICLNPADASLWCYEVEFNYFTKPNTVTARVK